MGYEVADRRFREWDKQTYEVLLELFDHNTYAEEFRTITEGYIVPDPELRGWSEQLLKLLQVKIELLKEFQRRIDHHLPEPAPVAAQEPDFWQFIHPEIVAVTKNRFAAREYGDTALAALRHVNTCVKDIVKRRTGNELEGADLMRQAFTPNNPIITIESLATENGRKLQQGFMEIFAGSMIGIRNPKAHENIIIGKERAIHFVFLASLLMDTIDIAQGNYRY